MKLLSGRAAPGVFGPAVRFAVLGVLLALVFAVGPAEAQLTRGSISGTVRDATAAIVPGATVTVTNQATNIARTAVTNELGFYRVPALEPGLYTVRAELAGFSTVENKAISVKTATEVTLNVELKVAGLGEELMVTGQAETVELNKSNPTIGLTSTARQVVELPTTAARNINQLALLTPNTYAAPGSTGIATNGQRARNNNFMVDGSDNNDISVTLVANNQIVPEWVAEFQVQTNPYNVEFGRNSGAQINVITRSGANNFHFDVWEYYRNAEAFNALSNIDKANGFTTPPELTRNQFGGDISGPIFKDKTFFFVSYQRDNLRPGPTPSTTTVRIPTPAGYAALQGVPLRAGQPASSRQAVLQRIAFLPDIYNQGAVFRNRSTTLVNGVAIETGQTNVNVTSPGTYNNFLGRIDHQLGRNDSLSLRYYYNQTADVDVTSNLGFGGLFAAAQNVTGQSLAASETHIFNQRLLNEFRFSWIKRDLQFPENDPTSPTAGITGLFTIGGLNNFPQGRVQDSFQFQDIVTLSKNRHTFKFGADIRYINLDNSAAFDSKGTFTFNNLQDYMNNVSNFQQALQTASFVAKQWQTFLFAQDDFRITPDLTLNLGLRYEITTIPLGFFGATDPESLAALVPGPTQKDTNNWAPRVGINWSPRSKSKFLGDGKTVLSGGYGISYDVLFYNILTVNASNYPRVVLGTLNQVPDLYPNVAPTTGAAVFNPLATWVNTPVDAQNPMTQFWSFSYQREFARDYILQVGYTGSHSTDGVNQLQANPGVLTEAQAALVASTKNSGAIPNLQARRVYPQYGSRVLIATTAKATYNGGFLSLQKRLSHGIQFGGSYSFSKWYSDNDESLGVAAITNSSPQIPQDYNNIAAEWSRSVFDRPHRFVVNYIWEVPGPKSGGWKQVLGGWQFSGVTQYQSGQPFTIVTGVDSNGNGGGADRPNVGTGSIVWDDDHKTFTNQGAYVVPLGTNNLPLLNSLGNGNAARNTERGAGYWNTDLSLLKRFYFGQRQLILRCDALNLFNQDSYGNPIANMSNVGFGTNTNDWGNRSLTLSVKFSY